MDIKQSELRNRQVQECMDRLMTKAKRVVEFTESVERWLRNYTDGNMEYEQIQVHRKIDEVYTYLSTLGLKTERQRTSGNQLGVLQELQDDLIESRRIMNHEIQRSATHLDLCDIAEKYITIERRLSEGRITQEDACALVGQLKVKLPQQFNEYVKVAKANNVKADNDFTKTALFEMMIIEGSIKDFGIENPQSTIKLPETTSAMESHIDIKQGLEARNSNTDRVIKQAQDLLDQAKYGMSVEDIQMLEKQFDALADAFNTRGMPDYESAFYIVRKMDDIVTQMTVDQSKAVNDEDVMIVANMCKRETKANNEFVSESIQSMDRERLESIDKQVERVESMSISPKVCSTLGKFYKSSLDDMQKCQIGVGHYTRIVADQQLGQLFKQVSQTVKQSEILAVQTATATT